MGFMTKTATFPIGHMYLIAGCCPKIESEVDFNNEAIKNMRKMNHY